MTDHPRAGGRFRGLWAAIRILNVRLRFILLMLLTGLIAAKWDSLSARWERWTAHDTKSAAVAESVEYYCPMDPGVIRDQPGNCPICGMPLSKRLKGQAAALPAGVIGRVTLSPYRIELGRIATSEIGARPLRRELRASGIVEPVERSVARIAARVEGRIEKVMADVPDGHVSAGEPLVSLYSPDLMATEKEYLVALRAAKAADSAANAGEAALTARSIAQAARERLRLWGVADEEIQALETAGEPGTRFTIRSPISGIITKRDVVEGQYVTEGADLYEVADLSRLRVTASVAESDAGLIRPHLPVEVSVQASPGRVLKGEVDFIEPMLDAGTRTIQVRILVDNPGGELRPGMYADVRIAAAGEDVLAVPESAVIDTGTRQVVYLESDPGVFDAIAVELGPLADGFYPVLTGLSSGDRVVTQGTFLVDAELRLSPGAAGSYFGASGKSGDNSMGNMPGM